MFKKRIDVAEEMFRLSAATEAIEMLMRMHPMERGYRTDDANRNRRSFRRDYYIYASEDFSN